MTRVLHVIPGLTGGGAERQLTLLSIAQVAIGHEVHIAIIHPEIPPQLLAAGVHVHRLNAASNFDPRVIWQLRSLIHNTRAQIVQTWLTLPDVMGGVAATLTSTPWVLSERSMVEAYPPNWRHTVRARLARRANAIVANSYGGVQYWESQGIPSARITEIPNAVDMRAAQEAVADPLSPAFDGQPLVVFAGRLADAKNPIVMVDALAMALKGTNTIAMLCGTGPLEHEMAERIRTLGAGKQIILAGHRADVVGLMKRAQLCLAISKFEGSPNVVIEAMAAGCPLVVSDIPAYRQLLDDSSALFVPLNDVPTIAHAIRATLDDQAAAQQRAARARARINARTPEHVASSLDLVYRKLVHATQ